MRNQILLEPPKLGGEEVGGAAHELPDTKPSRDFVSVLAVVGDVGALPNDKGQG